MTDEEASAKINAYLANHPHATRRKIIADCQCGFERCIRLHAQGMIVFPPPLTHKQVSQIGAKLSPWRTHFKLPGSPRFE